MHHKYTSEAGIAIEVVAALARHKALNVVRKYARKADQLKRAPSKNTADLVYLCHRAPRLSKSRHLQWVID